MLIAYFLTYGAEAWALNAWIAVFERRILKKITGGIN
jgi:hypothetical protein